jgi:hypothetical protein
LKQSEIIFVKHQLFFFSTVTLKQKNAQPMRIDLKGGVKSAYPIKDNHMLVVVANVFKAIDGNVMNVCLLSWIDP